MEQIIDLELWFRIREIQKKIDKLGPVGRKGFNWEEWEDLVDDHVNLVKQLPSHKHVVNEVLSRYN